MPSTIPLLAIYSLQQTEHVIKRLFNPAQTWHADKTNPPSSAVYPQHPTHTQNPTDKHPVHPLTGCFNMLQEANKPCGKSSNEQTLGATVSVPKLRLASAEWIKTDLLHSDGAAVCPSPRVQTRRAALLPLLSLEYCGERHKFRFCSSPCRGRLPERLGWGVLESTCLCFKE